MDGRRIDTVREVRRTTVHMLLRQAEEQSSYRLKHAEIFGREPLMHKISPLTSNRIALALPIIRC